MYPLFAKPFAPKKSYHARLSTIQSPCIGRYWPDVSVSRLNSIVQKGCAVWRAVSRVQTCNLKTKKFRRIKEERRETQFSDDKPFSMVIFPPLMERTIAPLCYRSTYLRFFFFFCNKIT